VNKTTPTLGYAPLIKRLAALTYDLMLYAAAFIAVGAIVTAFVPQIGYIVPAADLLPTLGTTITLAYKFGVSINSNPFYQFAIWVVFPILFFGWFWTRGGQTLSMRSWKIRIERLDGKNISWLQTILRLSPLLVTLIIAIVLQLQATQISIAVSCVGAICLAWSLFSSSGQGLHDILASTRVVKVEKAYVPPK